MAVGAAAAFRSKNEAAQKSRTRALDPALSTREVAEARRQTVDATFAHERLSAAVPQLQQQQRLKELAAEKKNARRWAADEKAEAERDKLACVYPPIADQLAELTARMAANNMRIHVINDYARPSGAKRLLSAEEMARGLRGFVDGYARIPRITKDLRVPAFTYPGYSGAYAWPRS